MKNTFFILLSLILISSCSKSTSRAIVLNGTSDYVTIAHNEKLNDFNALTIEAWIKPDHTKGYMPVLNKLWCAEGNPSYHFSVRDGFIEIVWNKSYSCDAINQYRSKKAIVKSNEWQHIAVVHTPSNVKFYYNGVLIEGELLKGDYSAIRNTSEPLRIGGYRSLKGEVTAFFKGGISDLRIWNVIRSSSEIKDNYASLLKGDESGLVALYSMNSVEKGSGVTLVNSSIQNGEVLNGVTHGSTATPKFVKK